MNATATTTLPLVRLAVTGCLHLGPKSPRRYRHSLLTAARHADLLLADVEGWTGEVEGLKVSLAGAEQKLAQLDEITHRRAAAVQLGIPTFEQVAGPTSTGETQ